MYELHVRKVQIMVRIRPQMGHPPFGGVTLVRLTELLCHYGEVLGHGPSTLGHGLLWGIMVGLGDGLM